MRLAATPRRDEVVLDRAGAARAEGDVVFARAALVGVAFDGDGVLRIEQQPLRLAVEGCAGLRRQFGRVGLEEHAVADVDRELLDRCPGGRPPARMPPIRRATGAGARPSSPRLAHAASGQGRAMTAMASCAIASGSFVKLIMSNASLARSVVKQSLPCDG